MGVSGFKLNSAVIQEFLDGQHGMEEVLDAEAERVAASARASAPVASGAYRDRIHVETEHTDRMVKRVVADVEHAMAVEADTGNLASAL